MAFRWHAVDGSALNAGLVAAIFQGIRTFIARKPNIFVIFQGGGGGPDPLSPPLWIRTCIIIFRSYVGMCCIICCCIIKVYITRNPVQYILRNGGPCAKMRIVNLPKILKYPFVVEKISMFDTDIKSCFYFYFTTV